MDHDPEEGKVFIATCDSESPTQKWTFGEINEEKLRDWLSYGKEIIDKREIKDLHSRA